MRDEGQSYVEIDG
jgi:hypothetical protein